MALKVTGGKGSTDTATPAGVPALAKGVCAHAEGMGNNATGDYSHAEGYSSTAVGNYSHAEGNSTITSSNAAHAEGNACYATDQYAHAEGTGSQAQAMAAHAQGMGTTASATASHSEGWNTTASGNYGHAQGVDAVASRHAQHAQAAGRFTAVGDAQACSFVAHRQTVDATPVALTFDGGAVVLSGAGANVLTVPVDRAYQFRVSAVARRSDVSGDAAGWEFRGLIARGPAGNNAAIIGAPVGSSWGSAGAAAWDVALSVNTADATNNYLVITATGEAGKTIKWVARIDTVEVVG
jgi:hypothetical protein